MDNISRSLLSATLKVAVKIYERQLTRKKPSTISQLLQDFDGELDEASVLEALDTLLDFGICKFTTEVQKVNDEVHLTKIYTIVG